MIAFNPQTAVASFERNRLEELILRGDAGLMSADTTKLAARLRALWESSTAPNNVTARTWLHEAGRLLADLPLGIALKAIDRAYLEADRGFLPSVATIRAHAEPVVAQLRQDVRRLRAVRSAIDVPATEPVDHPHAPGPLDGLSSTEILKRAWPSMAEHQTADAHAPRSLGPDPDRPCRAPTREDYLRMGVSAATLDGLAKPADDIAEAA